MADKDRPRRSGRLARGSFALGGMACGAIGSHFLDADRGHARRTRARDQLTAASRRIMRRFEHASASRIHYTSARATGALRRSLHNLVRVEPDDATLVQKVRSEVLGREAFRHYGISVDATDGVVHLRGEVPTPSRIDEVVAAVSCVYGVRHVDSYLHLPGAPAPNKEPVLAVRS
jgi:osmotically-inducible protein OsmY